MGGDLGGDLADTYVRPYLWICTPRTAAPALPPQTIRAPRVSLGVSVVRGVRTYVRIHIRGLDTWIARGRDSGCCYVCTYVCVPLTRFDSLGRLSFPLAWWSAQSRRRPIRCMSARSSDPASATSIIASALWAQKALGIRTLLTLGSCPSTDGTSPCRGSRMT